MRGLGSPLLAWTEGGRASVGLGSARKDSSAIAIGEEGCAGRCWISGVRLLCDAFALCTRCVCVRGESAVVESELQLPYLGTT